MTMEHRLINKDKGFEINHYNQAVVNVLTRLLLSCTPSHLCHSLSAVLCGYTVPFILGADQLNCMAKVQTERNAMIQS